MGTMLRIRGLRWRRSRELSWASRLPLRSVGVIVFADRGEPVLGVVELACDRLLDVGVKRGVRAEDKLTQHRYQGMVFAGQRGQFRPGGVDQAHGVVGEVGRFDHPGPRAGQEAGGDVLAVLLMLITVRGVDGVGDRGHQVGGTVAEPSGQHCEGGLPGPARRDVLDVVFDGIVEQCSARHIGVGDPVVAEDPDRYLRLPRGCLSR